MIEMIIGSIGSFSFFLIITYLELKYIREDEEKRQEIERKDELKLRNRSMIFFSISLILIMITLIPSELWILQEKITLIISLIQMLLFVVSGVFMGIALYNLRWYLKRKEFKLI